MTRPPISGPVASVPAHPEEDGPLWYRDPTGETAVRNLLHAAPGDDFQVIDGRGVTIFRIKRNTLIEAVMPHLTFTLTRRGRNTIRAHKKNAPDHLLQQARGDESL